MILEELKTESRTMILYEAPHHLIRTLEELYAALGERRITLCRELTKKFETVFPTTLEKALDYYKTEEPRGEYVLVVEGKSPEEKRQEEIASWESMSIEEHMAYYEEQGMDNKFAMKQVAKDRGVGKREIYKVRCLFVCGRRQPPRGFRHRIFLHNMLGLPDEADARRARLQCKRECFPYYCIECGDSRARARVYVPDL